MRRFGRTDATQRAIVAYLRTHGATVLSLANVGSGCPDLLVGYKGVTVLLECKSPGAGRSAREVATAATQSAWRARWRGGLVAVVSTPEDALEALQRAVGAFH